MARATKQYYTQERQTYLEAYNIYMSNAKALVILKKLCKHYERSMPRNIKFYGHRDSGSAGSCNMRLSNNPSLGLVMHEFAHYALLEIRRVDKLTGPNHGTDHHGTWFQSALNFVNQYALKKGYWKEYLNPTVIIHKPQFEMEALVEGEVDISQWLAA